MPRPRKPTNILKFTGALDKNPARGRAREHEPKSHGPIGAPPEELDEYETKAWTRIVEEAPRGVLTKRDRQVVFSAALLGGALIRGSREPKIIQGYRLIMNDLGMSPASASKVSAPPDEKPDAFAAV